MICGKTIYISKLEASKSIAGLSSDKRKKRTKDKPNQVYFCNDCDGWHVASSSKNKRKHDFKYYNSCVNTDIVIPEKLGKSKVNRLIIHNNLNFKVK